MDCEKCEREPGEHGCPYSELEAAELDWMSEYDCVGFVAGDSDGSH
jgi:hypothetical protein